MKKKAVVETQFNWLFVLIIGAVILAFFITLVQKYKPAHEDKISSTVVRDLESVITGAKVSTGTASIVEIPDLDIALSCSKYSIGSSSKSTRSNIIFAPDLIKGGKLIAWALDWSAPYRATNFLYLTSPQVRYILVGDNDLAKEINKALSDKINKELVSDVNLIKDKNNYKVKFVFFGNIDNTIINSASNKIEKTQDEDVTAIKVEGDIDSGSISFYKKNGNSFTLEGDSKYLEKESLIGAIFAEDKEMYNCLMEKAFKRLNLISRVYYERTTVLGTSGTTCSSLYNSALTEIDELKSTSDVGQASQAADNLKSYNSQLQQNSCPLIY